MRTKAISNLPYHCHEQVARCTFRPTIGTRLALHYSTAVYKERRRRKLAPPTFAYVEKRNPNSASVNYWMKINCLVFSNVCATSDASINPAERTFDQASRSESFGCRQSIAKKTASICSS